MALPPRIRESVGKQAGRLLRSGRRFERFDQIRQRHFWSTHLFVPDANGYIQSGDNFGVFTTPAGQNGQGFAVPLTDRETNWPSARRVPDNQNFQVTELGVTLAITPTSAATDPNDAGLDAVVPAAVANCFMRHVVVSIFYLTNQVPLGMCSDFAQAAGPSMGSYVPYPTPAIATGGGDTYVPSGFVTNGFVAPGLRRRLKIPILLQHGETFSFLYQIPRTLFVADYEIYARLDFWATESFVEKS